MFPGDPVIIGVACVTYTLSENAQDILGILFTKWRQNNEVKKKKKAPG